MNVAIVLAGGTGTRIGAGIPKQFIEIQGKPILAYTLERFEHNENIDAIEIVCHSQWQEETRRIAEKYHISKLRWLTEGGSTFQGSTMNGIFHLKDQLSPDDIVVISFGVSPMTTDEIIDDSIRVCRQYGNAIAAEDMTLCTCIMDDPYSTTQSILRETLKGFSNPWTFRYGEVLEAYETGLEQGILDTIEPHTTSLYFALGKRLYFSKTNKKNFKITMKEDLDIFEGLLLLEQQRKGRDHDNV